MELEDFMRQQFNGEDPAERFPFRAEYWEQAKALLEAAEQKRRRRKFFWRCFWGMGILLLVSTGAYLLRYGTLSTRTPGEADSFSNTGAFRLQRERPTGAKTADQTVSAPNAHASGATPRVSDPEAPSTGFPMANPRNLPRPTHRQAAPRDLKTTTADTGKSTPTVSPPTNEENLPNGMTGREGTADTADLKTAPAHLGLEAVPLLDFVLLTPNVRAPKPAKTPNVAPPKTKRRGLGLVVGAPVYTDAPKGRQAGAVVGLYVASEWREHWALSLGVQWRYRPVASIENILTDRQLRYSFGYTLDEWQRENWATHYLEAPLSVQRRWYRRNLEVGFVPGMLLGATDRMARQRSTLFPEATKLLESRYLDGNKLQYRPLYMAAFVGGGWTCSRHLEVYGRVFYRPDALRKKSGDAGVLDGKIWPEMGLRIGL